MGEGQATSIGAPIVSVARHARPPCSRQSALPATLLKWPLSEQRIAPPGSRLARRRTWDRAAASSLRRRRALPQHAALHRRGHLDPGQATQRGREVDVGAGPLRYDFLSHVRAGGDQRGVNVPAAARAVTGDAVVLVPGQPSSFFSSDQSGDKRIAPARAFPIAQRRTTGCPGPSLADRPVTRAREESADSGLSLQRFDDAANSLGAAGPVMDGIAGEDEIGSSAVMPRKRSRIG